MRCLRWHTALLLLLWLGIKPCAAQDQLVALDTREGVRSSYWWMPREGASATVLLFAGGHGGIGLKDGTPQSNNFLIRSRDLFANTQLNVALIGNPSDQRALTPAFRASAEHAQDIAATIQSIRQRSTAPIWLIGTSQGSISAAANAIALGPQIAGVVLSSSISVPQPGGSVPDLPLERIAVPVLVHQHVRDGCRITPASGAQRLLPRFTQAPIKKYWEVDGGENPSGNPCEALHYHGYIGMEAQAVAHITQWMQVPSNP